MSRVLGFHSLDYDGRLVSGQRHKTLDRMDRTLKLRTDCCHDCKVEPNCACGESRGRIMQQSKTVSDREWRLVAPSSSKIQ